MEKVENWNIWENLILKAVAVTWIPSHANRQGWQCNMRNRVDEIVGQEAVESEEPSL